MFRSDFDFFNQCDFNGKFIDTIENFFYTNKINNNSHYKNRKISCNFYDSENQPEAPQEDDQNTVLFHTPIKKLMSKPVNDLNNIITSDHLLYDLLNKTLMEERKVETPIKNLMAKPMNELDNITDDAMLLLNKTLIEEDNAKTPIKKLKMEFKTPTPIKKLISKPINDLNNIITSDEMLYDLLSLIEEEPQKRKSIGYSLQPQYNGKLNEEFTKIHSFEKEVNQFLEQQIECEIVPYDDNAVYI